HITRAQNSLQGLIAGWIFVLVSMKFAIEPGKQASLLKVITEVTRLRIIRALVIVVVERARVHRHQLAKRRHRARLDRRLQTGQTPIGKTVNVTINFTALFVKRAQTFVEPRGTRGKVCFDERMDDLVNQSAAAG